MASIVHAHMLCKLRNCSYQICGYSRHILLGRAHDVRELIKSLSVRIRPLRLCVECVDNRERGMYVVSSSNLYVIRAQYVAYAEIEILERPRDHARK